MWLNTQSSGRPAHLPTTSWCDAVPLAHLASFTLGRLQTIKSRKPISCFQCLFFLLLLHRLLPSASPPASRQSTSLSLPAVQEEIMSFHSPRPSPMPFHVTFHVISTQFAMPFQSRNKFPRPLLCFYWWWAGKCDGPDNLWTLAGRGLCEFGSAWSAIDCRAG